MKVSLSSKMLLTVLVCSVGFSGGAFATKIGVNGRTTTSHQHASCKQLYEMCLDYHSDGPCKILYDAAIKEGGNWSAPAAQAAAKIDLTKNDIATKNEFCHVDPLR